jgi:hypothetical protein
MSFQQKDRYGFVDTSVQVVIQPSFAVAREFVEGLATVDKAWGEWGAIDPRGQWVIAPDKLSLWSFNRHEDVTAFSMDNKEWGLLNRRGEVTALPRFSYLGGTAHGLTPAGVRASDGTQKYGVVDQQGEWVITPRFDMCDGHIGEKTLGAAVNGRWGIVDMNGVWIVEPRFTYAEAFHEGLSRVYVGGWNEDMALTGGKFGYIGRDGKVIVEPTFDGADAFKDGVGAIRMQASDPDDGNWKRGYIDPEGHYIWEPTR